MSSTQVSPSDLYEMDELQQYFGYGLKICDGLEIHQPTVGDIVRMGEYNYFNTVNLITAIPSDMKAQLDMMGIDWETMEDFELFCLLAPQMTLDDTRVLFGDLDFTKFKITIPENRPEGDRTIYLKHQETGLIIDELRYKAITNYLCHMHHIKKKPQIAGNAYTHKMLLEMAYEDMERNKKKARNEKSALKSLISTMVNMPGFKYNLQELMDVGYCQFMDSVSRIQVIESTTALMHGVYMGNVDMKKINKADFNYMRDMS